MAEQATSEQQHRAKYQQCPMDGCTERCEVYEGNNPFKQDTMMCPAHGRMAVKKA